MQLFRAYLKIAATIAAPTCARHFVRATLESWLLHHIAYDAGLIATELVTNAVNATGVLYPGTEDLEALAVVAVQVRVAGRALFLEVWDDDSNRHAKLPDMSDDLPENGRGLRIVNSVATGFGVSTLPSMGKVVWASLDAGPGIAKVPQMKPRPLPWRWRQVSEAPSRQLPQHAYPDVMMFNRMTEGDFPNSAV